MIDVDDPSLKREAAQPTAKASSVTTCVKCPICFFLVIDYWRKKLEILYLSLHSTANVVSTRYIRVGGARQFEMIDEFHPPPVSTITMLRLEPSTAQINNWFNICIQWKASGHWLFGDILSSNDPVHYKISKLINMFPQLFLARWRNYTFFTHWCSGMGHGHNDNCAHSSQQTWPNHRPNASDKINDYDQNYLRFSF